MTTSVYLEVQLCVGSLHVGPEQLQTSRRGRVSVFSAKMDGDTCPQRNVLRGTSLLQTVQCSIMTSPSRMLLDLMAVVLNVQYRLTPPNQQLQPPDMITHVPSRVFVLLPKASRTSNVSPSSASAYPLLQGHHLPLQPAMLLLRLL